MEGKPVLSIISNAIVIKSGDDFNQSLRWSSFRQLPADPDSHDEPRRIFMQAYFSTLGTAVETFRLFTSGQGIKLEQLMLRPCPRGLNVTPKLITTTDIVDIRAGQCLNGGGCRWPQTETRLYGGAVSRLFMHHHSKTTSETCGTD
jgi:hypothetical protein